MYNIDRIYIYKDCMYDSQPDGTYVVKRMVKDEIEYNYLKHESYVSHLLLVLACILVLAKYLSIDTSTVKLYTPSVLHIKDNILQYNICNPTENTQNIIVRLTYINEDVVSAINLKPSEELANISCTYFNVAGSYNCTLIFEVGEGLCHTEITRAVKVLVE